MSEYADYGTVDDENPSQIVITGSPSPFAERGSGGEVDFPAFQRDRSSAHSHRHTQPNRKNAAFSRRAGDSQRTVMCLYNRFGNGQPQPGPAHCPFVGPEKWLKDTIQIIGADADASVAHLDHRAIVFN